MCREGEAPLHRAARLGWSECVEELLSLKAEVGLRNHQRLTALDIAGQVRPQACAAPSGSPNGWLRGRTSFA